MSVRLSRFGHALLVVRDLAASRRFYTEVLGFDVAEEDPEHGGTFLTLGDTSHSLDLVQAGPDELAADVPATRPGVHHLAFLVASEGDLRDGYFALVDAGVPVLQALDHESQQSVYFQDPDGNLLEIYWERPDAVELFRRGRRDGDRPITFERVSP